MVQTHLQQALRRLNKEKLDIEKDCPDYLQFIIEDLFSWKCIMKGPVKEKNKYK